MTVSPVAPGRAESTHATCPTPAETAELSRTLEEFSKPHEFHTFAGAGHAFFSVDRPSYRVEATVEGWDKIWAFFGEQLAGKA